MIKILTITALLITLLSGCMETRYITEKHIKNNIEEHDEGEFSTIKTYTVFKGYSRSRSAYIELTGYKYKGRKALVIGADRYYKAREQFEGDNTKIANINYIELTLPQCQAIIDNQKIIENRVKEEKPMRNEEIYHDYSVSEDLFISYRMFRASTTASYLDLWIKGEKYQVSSYQIIRKIKEFLKY